MGDLTMKELLESGTFWTVLMSIGGPILSYFVSVKKIEQKQTFQDEKIESNRLAITKAEETAKSALDSHKQDVKEKDLALWNQMGEIRTSLTEMVKTLTRVETKLEIQQKGDHK